MIWRVSDRATFVALRRSRQPGRRGPITVTFVPGDPNSPPRVAYAVGRKAGGAVERNRIRRRLRAAVRAIEADLEPGAYLVGATEEAARLSPAELHGAVSKAARDATVGRRP